MAIISIIRTLLNSILALLVRSSFWDYQGRSSKLEAHNLMKFIASVLVCSAHNSIQLISSRLCTAMHMQIDIARISGYPQVRLQR